MMHKYGDLMASVGEYFDARSGRQAKRTVHCGVVMRDDQSGKLSVKLDTVPVSPQWSGWLSVKNITEDPPEERTSIDNNQLRPRRISTPPGGEHEQ